MKTSLIAITLLLIGSPFLQAEDAQPFPGKKTEWKGFTMYQDGQNKIVLPEKTAEGKPWIWRARFWGHEPAFDIAMLNKGYHIAYCHVAGLYGSPKAVTKWDNFYKTLTTQYGFSKKPVLEGMSRGGLIIYNWAIANPDKVSVIYGDAPVMDFKSWPGAEKAPIHKAYDFAGTEEAKAYKGNPVDNLAPLAKAGVPIIHIVGDVDKIVPVSENTAIAEKRYLDMGGTFKVIHKENVGHHPHALKDPTPLIEFVEKYAK